MEKYSVFECDMLLNSISLNIYTHAHMRRRGIIGEKKPLVLILSSYSYNATPASGSTTVYAYYGGVPINNLTSSMVTYSGNMSSVSVNSNGVITMSYNSNTSTTSTATSKMTLTYQGQTKTFTITQAKDYKTDTTTSTSKTWKHFNSGDQGIKLNVTLVKTANGYENEALTNVTVGEEYTTTTYYDVYASGKNIPAGFYTTNQTSLSMYTDIVPKASSVIATIGNDTAMQIKKDGSGDRFTIDSWDVENTYPYCYDKFEMYVTNMSNYPNSVVTLTQHVYNSYGTCID